MKCNRIILWLIVVLLINCCGLMAQNTDGNRFEHQADTLKSGTKLYDSWTEEDGLNRLDQMALWDNRDGEIIALFTDLPEMSELAARLNSAKMVEKIVAFPDYKDFKSEYPPDFGEITGAKVRAMQYLKDFPIAREYVIKNLDHESKMIQIDAAVVLLSWDEEWDRSVAILRKYNAIYEFGSFKNDRAIPVLKDIASNGGWSEKFQAGMVLYNIYNDTTALANVSLDIISNASVNYDKKMAGLVCSALKNMPKSALLPALPDMIRLLDYGNSQIRGLIVEHLIYLHIAGNKEAINALINVRDNDPDERVREKAREGLIKPDDNTE